MSVCCDKAATASMWKEAGNSADVDSTEILSSGKPDPYLLYIYSFYEKERPLMRIETRSRRRTQSWPGTAELHGQNDPAPSTSCLLRTAPALARVISHKKTPSHPHQRSPPLSWAILPLQCLPRLGIAWGEAGYWWGRREPPRSVITPSRGPLGGRGQCPVLVVALQN